MISLNKTNYGNFGGKVMIELKPPTNLNLNKQIISVDGNLTLNEIEKKAKFGDFIFDRGMSIKNLDKKLSELTDQNSYIGFNLLNKSDKLIKDLEESEINFENYSGLSCYQSASLQGFIHILFPLAIRNVNKEREKIGKQKVKDLDELKNNSNFNNTIIDTIKEILYIQGCGNGGVNKNGNKRYQAKKLFEIAPPHFLGGGGEGPENIGDVNDLHGNLSEQAKNLNDAIKSFATSINGNFVSQASPPKKLAANIILSFESSILNGNVKIIEIKQKTIISEIMKFRIEGKYEIFGNLVLKFNNEDLNDSSLDVCKLIKNSPQIKINNFSYRKITNTSDVIFMITDRYQSGYTIKKQFILYEKIYLENGYFSSSNIYGNNILFELKFVIFHRLFDDEKSGHYIAFSKIRNEWLKFNDLTNDYAESEKPPLIYNYDENYYPVAFYYVKNNENISSYLYYK